MTRGYSAVGLFKPKHHENVGSALRAAGVYGASMVAIDGARGKALRHATHYTPRIATDAMIAPPQAKPVSLAPIPFQIPPASRDETKPTTPPVRGEITPEEKRWMKWMEKVK